MNPYNSYGLILLSQFTHSVFSRNSTDVSDRFCGSNFVIGTDRSCLPNSFSVFAFHGVLPVSSSKYMTPIAHTSLLKLYLLSLRAYGGMQIGEPTLQELYFLDSEDFMAKPKSAILILLFFNRILAGLRSLCIILFALI